MPFGTSVHDDSAHLTNGRDTLEDLDHAMPSLEALGKRLLAATAIELGDDHSARLVYLAGKDVEQERDLDQYSVFPAVEWGLATCASNKRYALIAPPVVLGNDIRVDVMAVERIKLPGGAQAVSVTQELTFRSGAYRDDVLILGKGTPETPVREPAGASAGIMARIGSVAYWKHLPRNRHESIERLEASAWYPLGRELVYLHLRRDDKSIVAELRGHFDRHGMIRFDLAALRPTSGASALRWALVGWGELPAGCDAAKRSGRARCEKIEVPTGFILTPEVTWIAGVWGDAKEARVGAGQLQVDPTTTRWLAINAGHRPLGPDGKPSLTVIQVKRAPFFPPPP